MTSSSVIIVRVLVAAPVSFPSVPPLVLFYFLFALLLAVL
jgi:hypothetical protein